MHSSRNRPDREVRELKFGLWVNHEYQSLKFSPSLLLSFKFSHLLEAWQSILTAWNRTTSILDLEKLNPDSPQTTFPQNSQKLLTKKLNSTYVA